MSGPLPNDLLLGAYIAGSSLEGSDLEAFGFPSFT